VRIRPFFAVWAALSLLVAATGPARASGPFVVTGDGRPCRFDPSQPVHYVVDAGPFGSRSHAQAVALVQQAFRTWEAVPTALLRFEAAGELPQDIDGRSAMAFLNGLKPGDASPVLLDSDGSILEVIFGRGASDESSGFAYPWWREPGSGRLLVSAAVLNAKLPFVYTDGAVLQSVIHELGHFVGLEHSQLNGEGTYDGDSTNDHLAPAMSYSWGPNSAGHLHREDEAWFSWLYPSPDFAARTGSIRGRVLLPDGVTGLMGVTVIARRVGDPLATAVSNISGYLFGRVDDALRDPGRPGDFGQIGVLFEKVPAGASELSRLGEFLIPGLPPGSYTLELAQTLSVPSVSHVGYLVGGPKFWRQGSSAHDPPTESTPITVNAGQEISGIDIVVNGQNLGEPRPVTEQEPNSAESKQTVPLPADIHGAVEDDAGPTSELIQELAEAEDVYRVDLPEWTTITAILSASQPATDLDLYIFAQGEDSVIRALSATGGSSSEVLQVRLPPGPYSIGVHHAGGPASAYTLRLLATPAPEPAQQPQPALLKYVLIGDITPTSAVIRWETTQDAPTVLYTGTPLREIGSTRREREHQVELTGLPSEKRIYTLIAAAGVDGLFEASPTTATRAAPGGAPQLAVESHAVLGPDTSLVPNSATATVSLTNKGDGDALDVYIDELIVAPGWQVLSEALSAPGLPDELEFGQIGAGGEGELRVRLVQRGGSSDPAVVAHGWYYDADGTEYEF
jgi:hypothetical protein